MRSLAESRHAANVDSIRHPAVQPWSAGPLFPAVIARIDHHPTDGGEAYASSWVLMLDGREEHGYESRDAAEYHARLLLADPARRAAWAAGED